MDDELLGRLRARVAGSAFNDMGMALEPRATPTAEELSAYEARLGVTLPGILRAVILAVGTGVGPGYGLIAIGGAVDPALLARKLVPIVNWGCGIYSVVDCAAVDAPVYVWNSEAQHVLDAPSTSWTLTAAAGNLVAQHQGTAAVASASTAPSPPRVVLHEPSLDAWLRAWVDGVSLWDEMEMLPSG